jgi:hypothetical protein
LETRVLGQFWKGESVKAELDLYFLVDRQQRRQAQTLLASRPNGRDSGAA